MPGEGRAPGAKGRLAAPQAGRPTAAQRVKRRGRDRRLSPDKKSFWVRAVVLLLTTGTVYGVVAVTSRHFSQVDFTSLAGDDAGTAAQPPADGPPGAPTRAQVKQLHDALL